MSQLSSEQPGRPASVAPPPLPPGYPVAKPRKTSTVLKVVLNSAAAILVLGVVGLVVVLIATKKPVDNINESAAKVSIVEPQRLGGRAPLTDPQFTAMTDVMEQGLTTYRDATNSFGAFYGEAESQNIVVAMGIERPVFAPAAALAGAFGGLAIGGLRIDGIAPVEPGALGGVAKCGTADAGGTDLAVCGWADEGSIGILMWYFATADQVTAEFTQLRAEIETKTD